MDGCMCVVSGRSGRVCEQTVNAGVACKQTRQEQQANEQLLEDNRGRERGTEESEGIKDRLCWLDLLPFIASFALIYFFVPNSLAVYYERVWACDLRCGWHSAIQVLISSIKAGWDRQQKGKAPVKWIWIRQHRNQARQPFPLCDRGKYRFEGQYGSSCGSTIHAGDCALTPDTHTHTHTHTQTHT